MDDAVVTVNAPFMTMVVLEESFLT